jgi:hypothetical protein
MKKNSNVHENETETSINFITSGNFMKIGFDKEGRLNGHRDQSS